MMLLSILALVGSASGAALDIRQTSGDPCAGLIGVDGYYKPSDIKACLHSIPFREDVRQNIMAGVTALNTLSIFQYNQLGNDNSVINQGVDLDAEFKRISSASYESDYEFQNDLSVTIRSLNDGHYAWNSCYDNTFIAVHYLPIVSLLDGDETSIFLAPNLPTYASRNGLLGSYAGLGYNFTQLAGSKVTAIEGQSPWVYLDTVAGVESGTYQDPEQRLNNQFASYTTLAGGFALQPGQFTQTTSFDSDDITITVELDGKKVDVKIPWLGIYAGNEAWSYTSGEAFFNATCLIQPGDSSSTGAAGSTNAEPTGSQESNTTIPDASVITDTTAQAYAQCPINTTAARYQYSNSPQAGAEYLGGRDIQFYALGDDKKTGVIYLSTFQPRLPISQDPIGLSSEACTNRFIVDTYLGFRNFTKAGVERIMIDTSNNGGGSVALNQFLQRYLTGDDYEVDLNFETLLRKSPLAEALLKANLQAGQTEATSRNIYQPGQYRHGKAKVPVNEDIFTPGNQYTINGETLSTSHPLQDDVQIIDTLESALNISDTPPYSPDEIVFIGNGLCGSACSSFTNFLIEYYNATAYITSGRPQNPIEFQAFAAGQATTSELIYEEAASVGFTDNVLLPPLQVKGEFGFTVRGAVSPNIAPGTFVQYRSYPAQGTCGLTAEQFLNPIENWKFVASKAFASNFGDEGKRSEYVIVSRH